MGPLVEEVRIGPLRDWFTEKDLWRLIDFVKSQVIDSPKGPLSFYSLKNLMDWPKLPSYLEYSYKLL